MSRMFGERINEFVLSIDIMDQETFFDLLNLIQVYVNEHLDIAYFSVLDETTVNNRKGLRTLWSTRDERPAYSIDKESGYSSHSAYTFGQNKPIWVVSESKDSLQTQTEDNLDDKLIEKWSDSSDLPSYSTQNREKIKTSVMHPLRKNGNPIGVVEFAAERYIEPTFASRLEVQTLATVIARAYRMFEVRKEQRENTKNALKKLEEALKKESWTRLALPQLFVAYSGTEKLEIEEQDRHKVVIDAILGVIKEFEGILSIVDWAEVSESGNINEQVIYDITNSEFGLS